VLAGGSLAPNVMRLMPPITITDDEIDTFTTALAESIDSVRLSADQEVDQ